MGMYTEFVLAVSLREDTPGQVIDILRYMTNQVSRFTKELPDHPLFRTDGWKNMLISNSPYISGDSYVSLNKHYLGYGTVHKLTVRSVLKNYDSEIELFLDWISEYIDCDSDVDEFLGYFRREDMNNPMLIYFNKWCKDHVVLIASCKNNYYKKPLLDYLPNLWFDWVERRSAK